MAEPVMIGTGAAAARQPDTAEPLDLSPPNRTQLPAKDGS
jgi:hypothetical protein